MKTIARRNFTASGPDGYFKYKQPETGKEFEWQTSWQALTTAVGAHRRGYNVARRDGPDLDLDPGWELRLEHQFCEQNPKLLCLQDGTSPLRHIKLSDVKSFIEELRAWNKAGRPSVPHEEAERRAAICASCQFNVPVGSCLGCAQMADFLNLVSGSQPTKQDANLRHCAHCGCALKSMTHWPLEFINDHPDLPSFCWRLAKRH